MNNASKMGLLSTQEVADRAGISYRQIDWWVRNGLIHPAVDADGPGTRRLWGREIIPQLAVMGRVTRAVGVNKAAGANGAPHHILAAVAEHWKQGQAELDEGVVLSWASAAATMGHDR